MRRALILAVAFVAGVAVCDARAQTAAPSVELGLDVSAVLVADRENFQRGPRLVVNLDGRNSVQVTVGLQELSRWDDFAQRETDSYMVAYRRIVHAAGPVRVSATIGGGLERTVIFVPAITFGSPPVTFPSSRGVEVLPVFTTGAGIDLRLGRHAAIVLDSSFGFTDTPIVRFSGGLVVPLGSYPSASARLAPSVPWAALDAGERAWVTTADGREIDGEVVGRSAGSLALRTRTGIVSLTIDDVRAIDTTDSIRNGTVLGATFGGAGALVPSLLITLLVCSLEDCDGGDVLWINGVVVGMGAAIGAATGALVDSLRERREPLYRRGATVTVAPMVGAHRVGGRAVIRW